MEAILAAEVISTITLNKDERIERFNSMITSLMVADRLKHGNTDKPFRLELPFTKFGNTIQDIQFVIDAGYAVYSNITDNVWIVRLFSISSNINDEYVIPTANEIKLTMPSIESRRHAIFNKYVDEERNKTDPSIFKVRLDPNDFPNEQDIEFIRKLGYDVIKANDNTTIHNDCDWDWNWVVTLPGED